MFDLEPVKKWFGYSRKERRASAVLLSIIILVLTVRYLYPDKSVNVKDVTEEMTFIANREDAPVTQRTYQDTVKAGKKSSPVNPGRYYPKKATSKIELNTCDSAMLVALPGIGPVLSARIIKFRNLLGGYAEVEQLREVYGLPPETYDLIKGRLTADTSLIKHIRINTADYRELSKLPYLENYEVTSVLKYRKFATKIRSLRELEENKILTAEKISRIRPYIVFD
jgi:DNA uptake protein ComE-like DNA-binding protein